MKKRLDTFSQELLKYTQVKDILSRDLDREPLPEEIATEMGVPLEKIYEYSLLKIEEEDEKENSEFGLKFKLTIKNNELEKARLALGLKQEELARKVGIGTVSYSSIECCRNFPSPTIQADIAEILKIPVDLLFPKWLESFSEKWKRQEKSRVVPISQLSLNSPDVLQLDSGDYERMVEKADASYVIDKLFKNITMSSKEREIINDRYGLIDGDVKDLETVGRKFGVSRERIRQIESRVFDKIRNCKNDLTWKD